MTTYLEKREKDSFQTLCNLMASLKIADPVIFDGGANTGQSIQKYKATFPNSVIHSFEPNPETFKILKNNWGDKNNIFLYPCGLNSRAGSFPFHATRVSEASSLLQPDPKLMKLSSQKKYDFNILEVECTTLDRFCKDNQLLKIDILKLDVQGAELEALKGGIELIKSGAISLLYVEVNFAETYLKQMQFKDLLEFCNHHGYQLWDLSPFLYTRTGRLWYANTIFLSAEAIQAIESKYEKDQS